MFYHLKVVLILITLMFSVYSVRRYRHIPSVSLTLLCFIMFQMIVNSWFDLLFLFGVAFTLVGINIEYIKLYNESKKN